METSKCDQVLMERYKIPRNRKKQKHVFAKQFSKARNLFSGSTLPAMIWRHPVSGLSSSMILEAERIGARCSGITPGGKCRFITNSVVYGPKGHPVARILKELFITWFDTLAELIVLKPQLYSDLRDAWRNMYKIMDNTLQR